MELNVEECEKYKDYITEWNKLATQENSNASLVNPFTAKKIKIIGKAARDAYLKCNTILKEKGIEHETIVDNFCSDKSPLCNFAFNGVPDENLKRKQNQEPILSKEEDIFEIDTKKLKPNSDINVDIIKENTIGIPIGSIVTSDFSLDFATTENCMNNDYHIGKFIAAGHFGRVYEITEKSQKKGENNNNLIVKVFRIHKDNHVEKEHFKQQAAIIKKMGELGVGPIIYNSWICEHAINKVKPPPHHKMWQENSEIALGFIVADRLDITLGKFSKSSKWEENKFKIRDALLNKTKTMWKNGYRDTDTHDENFMIKLNEKGDPIDIFYVDFGFTSQIKKRDMTINDPELQKFIKSIELFNDHNMKKVKSIKYRK